jgi:hypothetical protein
MADAIEGLYRITRGHPRNACGLAQLALEVAAQGDGDVTSAIIERVKDKRILS